MDDKEKNTEEITSAIEGATEETVNELSSNKGDDE